MYTSLCHQVKLLEMAMPPPPRRRTALRPAVQRTDNAAAAGAAAADLAPGSIRRGSSGSGSSSGNGGSPQELSDCNAGNGNSGGGGGHGGSGAGELADSGKQEGEWAAGPGAQRISPAVEALTMLARNNTKNRWDCSKPESKPHPTHDPLTHGRLSSRPATLAGGLSI